MSGNLDLSGWGNWPALAPITETQPSAPPVPPNSGPPVAIAAPEAEPKRKPSLASLFLLQSDLFGFPISLDEPEPIR